MPAGRRRSAPKASAARPPGWTVRSRRPIGKGSLGSVMRFHGVCGRLVSHPLHENRLPGDTLFKNPHRPSKAAGLETPVNFHERIENKLFLDRTRKDSNFKRPHICATLFQIEKCWAAGVANFWRYAEVAARGRLLTALARVPLTGEATVELDALCRPATATGTRVA